MESDPSVVEQAVGIVLFMSLVVAWFGWKIYQNSPGVRAERFEHYSAELEGRLSEATERWTLPVIVGSYESSPAGQSLFSNEASILGKHGYVPASQSADGGHVHVGRLLATGGLSIFAGRKGIRSQGAFTVAYHLASPSGQSSRQRRTTPSSRRW